MISVRDISEQKDIKKALKQMKWLNHMDQTITHEMISPLLCITTFVDRIIKQASNIKDNSVNKELEIIKYAKIVLK